MDAARLLEMEQILDDVVIPSPPEPARVEAFRRDAGEGDVEAGLEIVVHELRWVATPQRGEDTEPDLIRNPVHAGVLIIRCDGPDDHPVDVDPPEDPPQRVELAVLSYRRGLPDQGDSHRLGLERRELQARRVAQHRRPIFRSDPQKLRHAADVIQRLNVVDGVARRTNAYVGPAIRYGVCTTTRPYPGTVSVSVDALKGFVRDVLADFVRNGVRRVMILSGHAGREHMMALRAAAQEVVDEGTGLRATVLSDYDIIYASQGILPEGDGHAGAGETSRMMTARPDLLKGKSPPGKNEIPSYAVVSDPRKYWSGVTGDPSKASKALGEKLDDLVIEELVKLVEELRGRD